MLDEVDGVQAHPQGGRQIEDREHRVETPLETGRQT
jgi:hypothetical protein